MNWSYVLEKYAKEYPEKEAIGFEGRRITYRRLNERVNALARGLLDFGYGRGDVIGILLYNCLEFMELTFAINKIGAIWLPLNFRLAGDELAYILDNGNAKALFSEADFQETLAGIRDRLPLIRHYIAIGKNIPAGWESYDHVVARNLGAEVRHERIELGDLQRLMYTSGTTAHPKGVMITYENLYWKNFAHIIELGITPDDRVLVVAPLYHVGGLDLPATGVMQVGGSLYILRKFDTMEVMNAIERERPTIIWMAPAMINMLFQEPTFGNYDVSSVRLIIDGAEKMPLPLIQEVIRRFPGTWFADAYGLTETVSGDTFLSRDKMVERVGSVGKPVIGLRIRVVDDDGRDVPPGNLGEIILRGPKVFKGYWRNEEATREVIKEGWFHTGDIGYFDEDGYLYIEDRKKDIIISGGENVSSLEVERVIYELPQVFETAIVGIPHPKWLEVPKAFVVLKPGERLTEQQIIDHCANKLAKFKVPKEVEFIPQLPRNPSGKVLKRELRKQSAGR